MDYPVTQQDILLCTLPNRVARLKVELLTMQGQTLLELTSETIDGGLTIESESDVRRIVDLTLECINETYNFGADKRIWFDKKIGLSYGILAPDDVWHDYPLGVFAFTGANFSYDENASRLKISAADLMAFTLQDRGSQIGASEVVIEVDSNIRNAMIETLKRFTPLVDYAITEFPADQQVVPYDVSVDSGAYPHDIIKKLRDLYPNYETYIDAYGTFVCNKIPERTDDPLFLDETVIDPLIISEQVRTDFGVRNVTEIWGAEIEPDRTMQECIGIGEMYHAALVPYEDVTIVKQPDNIKVAVGGQATFHIDVVGENLTYQWQYSQNSGADWVNSGMEGNQTDTLTFTAKDYHNGYIYRCLVSGRIFNDKQMPKATASGKVVAIDNTSDAPIRGLNLYGKTEQRAITGAQLLDISKAKSNSNVNFAIAYDSFELVVAADGQYRQLPAISIKHFDTAGEKATISLSYEIVRRSNPDNNVYFVVYWYKDGKRISEYTNLMTLEYPSTSITFTSISPVDNCDMGLIICANKNNTAVAGDSVVIKNLMVCESVDPMPYEPYTGGTAYEVPSDTYHHEILSAGSDGNVKITTSNKRSGIEIVAQPVNQIGLQGDIAVFRVRAKGEGLTYQWMYLQNGKFVVCQQPGNATPEMSFVIRPYHDGYLYYCAITDSLGNTINSETVSITYAEASAIRPITRPTDATKVLGDTAVFVAEALGYGLTYEWQWKDPKSETGWSYSSADGSKTNRLCVVAEAHRNGYEYRCVIRDGQSNQVISDVATLTIDETASEQTAIVTVPEGGGGNIVIVSQPKNVKTPLDAIIAFEVIAYGNNLKYKWQLYNPSTGKWADSTASGATTNKIELTAQSHHDGFRWRCEITDADGKVITTKAAAPTIDDTITAPIYDSGKAMNGLRGLPVSSGGNYTDENGQQWIADTIEYDAETGKAEYVKRVEIDVLDETAGWKKSSNVHVDRYYVTIGKYDKVKVPAMLCNIGLVGTTNNSMTVVGQVGIDSNRNFSYNYAASGASTLDGFLTHIANNPIVVAYPITNHIKTELPAEETALIAALKTYYPETTVYNEDGAFMDVVYSTLDKTVETEAISEHAVLLIDGKDELLKIVNQPKSTYAAMGNAFEFTVEATGVASYQWQWSSNGGKDWNNSTWESGTTATLTAALNESRAKMCFRCILTGTDGTSSTTNTVIVHEIPSSIEIVRQPVNAKAILGEIIHFSVSAKGATTYQWQRSVDGGSTWSDLDWAGNNTPVTYATAESSLITGSIYRCVLTAANGDQLTTNTVCAVESDQYVYVNDELICVVPDADNEAGQKIGIEELTLCPIIIRKYSTDGRQIDEPIAAGVMKAGYPYVLRYMDGVFLYEGELNVHAIVKEVGELPSEEERAQDQIDNDCRAIEYVVNPESPFTVEKIGEIRQVLSGGEYEDIYTSQLAIERCRWENWKKTRLNDGATVTMLLLPFMEVNKKIRYTSPRTGERLTYIVKSVSMDFSGSTMTLELVRFYPYYIWQ